MWTENIEVIRTVSASKLERYRHEAEVARALTPTPLRGRLASSLRLLADRLEFGPHGIGSQGVTQVAGSGLGNLPRLRA